MAELQIDQSNLPRVQEVCQSFAVLEDGALAQSLQAQEIEQYYTTNVQKSRLVQNDIRVAKRLQDEEEAQRTLQRDLLRQESRELEEQDLEYARVIQEEIRRRAEEARRRERDDEEMAKRMQEEEELRMRRSRTEEERHRRREGSAGGSAPPSPNRHPLGGQHPGAAAARWRSSNTWNPPDYSWPPPPPYYPAGVADNQSPTWWSSEGHTHSRRQLRRESQASPRAHADFFERRPNTRNNTPPLRRRLSLRLPRERDRTSLYTANGVRETFYDDNERQEKRSARDRERELDHRAQNTTRSHQDGAPRSPEARERRCRRGESLRIHDRPGPGRGDASGTWSTRDDSDKRVRFAPGDGGSGGRSDPGARVWEMLGHVLRERGVAVTLGGRGAPLKIGPQRPDGQASPRPHQRAAAGHSFHGDRRASSRRDDSEPDCGTSEGDAPSQTRGTRRRRPDRGSVASQETLARTPGGGGQREGEAEPEPERRLRRSLSSPWVRWRRAAAGASLPPKKRQTGLDLGDLQQVLLDEELARELQEQEQEQETETTTSERVRKGSQPRPRSPDSTGDFRVAQVAQDEEIARYMQKQEIQLDRTSRESEGAAEAWREHRAVVGHCDRRTARDKQAPRQRQRLDSEGLPSPAEDSSPENGPPDRADPPSLVSGQSQRVQNVAEELDPTFQAKRQGADVLGTGQSGGAGCQSLPEAPTFIPPTKRQKDKDGRAKPKEKKESFGPPALYSRKAQEPIPFLFFL
ncbi:coiled-coil domain-containing protein 187 isoform X2 [Syngnathoides biaculeatus]|uniref:coiled-coil domain-containing protein 187 isoform X2 n=1 Tax=Syngnathoides biaculeatus TaxID=300417 RepID=UPI002ADE3F23|nr:coiled-coil domain-containing protein 187 isoform X2 [Syngnathoides biaculeatus]